MDNLMLRRRQMMQLAAAPSPSEWDYEWTYTDGVPTSSEWTKTGADTPSIVTGGMQVNRSYFTKDIAITNGVIEAKFTIPSYRTSSNTNRALLRIGDSSNCIYVIFYRYSANKICLYDASNLQSSNPTLLGSFSWGSEYTVRININGSTGSVEINGTTVKDNIDTTTMYPPGTLLWGNNAQYGRSVWQYLRYKSLS